MTNFDFLRRNKARMFYLLFLTVLTGLIFSNICSLIYISNNLEFEQNDCTAPSCSFMSRHSRLGTVLASYKPPFYLFIHLVRISKAKVNSGLACSTFSCKQSPYISLEVLKTMTTNCEPRLSS